MRPDLSRLDRAPDPEAQLAFDAGTPTESGGDTELFGQLLDAGFTLVHEPAARDRRAMSVEPKITVVIPTHHRPAVLRGDLIAHRQGA